MIKRRKKTSIALNLMTAILMITARVAPDKTQKLKEIKSRRKSRKIRKAKALKRKTPAVLNTSV